MSEKRFECVFKEHETKNSWSMIKDNQLDKPLYIKDVVDLLNEQQATIRRLQDLCGESDGENAKLRQQQQRLYNYFRDYLEDEMSAENFGEMWDNVKEDERWNDE